MNFFSAKGIWIGFGTLALVMFAIAGFPRFEVDSLPWLILSIAGFAIAFSPEGTGRRARLFAVELLWSDRTMRWHFISALALSTVGTLVTLGITGILPVWLTYPVFHPWPSAWVNLQSPNGDQVWPYMILCSFLWPWAFPCAWFVSSRWGASAFGLTYFFTALSFCVLGTLSLILLMFQRVFFFFLAK